jgi:hypothetical protein
MTKLKKNLKKNPMNMEKTRRKFLKGIGTNGKI